MYIAIGAAAFLAGICITAAVYMAAIRAAARRRKKAKQPETVKRKLEYTKLILALVLLTYFIGVGVGVWVVLKDFSQLYVVLTFIGAPTAAAIGFYVWKAKAENIIKIKRANPEETEGIPVDLNNIER